MSAPALLSPSALPEAGASTFPRASTLTVSGQPVYDTSHSPGLGEVAPLHVFEAKSNSDVSGCVLMCADDEPVNRGLFRAEFSPEFKWHVLHVRSRQEKILADEMRRRDVQCFLPLVSRVRFYAGRKAVVEAPLFPGYVFLRGSLDDAYTADRSKRLAGIIPVLDQRRLNWELQNIHRALGSGQELDAFPGLQARRSRPRHRRAAPGAGGHRRRPRPRRSDRRADRDARPSRQPRVARRQLESI